MTGVRLKFGYNTRKALHPVVAGHLAYARSYVTGVVLAAKGLQIGMGRVGRTHALEIKSRPDNSNGLKKCKHPATSLNPDRN